MALHNSNAPTTTSSGTTAPPVRIRRTFLDYVHTKTFTPREYQVELLDSSKERNVVVCMGKVSGKTFIAVQLIRELSSQTRDLSKKTVFLALTANFVKQKKRILEDHTDLKVGQFYSSLGVDFWSKEEWEEAIESHQILVMTPEIFLDIISQNIIKLDRINLLVMEDCQKAVRKHAYQEIMRHYVNYKEKGNQPRILGLCPSLLTAYSKPKDLKREIDNLEKNLESVVETASDLVSVNQYVTKPAEEIIRYENLTDTSSYYVEMQRCLDEALNFFYDLILDFDDDSELPHPTTQPIRYLMEISYVLVTLGPWCAHKAAKVFMVEISRILEVFCHSEIHLQMILVARSILETLVSIFLNFQAKNNSEGPLIDTSSPKLKRLLEILKPYKPEEEESAEKVLEGKLTNCLNNSEKLSPEENDTKASEPELNCPSKLSRDSVKATSSGKMMAFGRRRPYVTEAMAAADAKALCAVVFVKQKVVAYTLNLWLNEVAKSDPEFKFLRPNFVVGQKSQNSSKNRHSYISFQHQEDTLRRFCCREYNILFSTSVLEEGMNVPKCNLIVRLDLPDNFHSYIHSKARARAPESKYCIFVRKGNDKFLETLSNYRQIESILSRKKRGHDSANEDINDEKADSLKPPYIAAEGGAKVSMSTSIALVNRYCCKLPSDTFTRLTPKWNVAIEENANESLFVCTIWLPINSPLKKAIKGDGMPSKSLAKMAAALEVCKKLHEIGELDDNLLPVGKEAVKFEEDTLETFDIEQVPQGAPRPGTTKRRQYYYKMVAESLRGPSPSKDVKCLLYRFSMVLTCPIPEEQNTRGRKIYNPAETTRGFGILTTKPIPPICTFPVFTRSGEVTVDLERIADDISVDEEKVSELVDFHRYAFKDVLCLEKYPMIFKEKEGDNSFYLVPLNLTKGESQEWSIDWDFVSLICKSKKLESRKIPADERIHFQFNVQDYADAVVMPWYRNLDKPQFFYVAEICSDLTPLSDFPDFGYDTFKDYYQEKYNIQIMNPDQPLLDVDHTSARLNLLTPRYVNRKGISLPVSSENTKKNKRENLQQKQILIPELCIIHPFPASLWRKAVCLPCILYRINSLLLAEQLRVTVAREIGVGNYRLPSDYKWQPLDFGWTLAEVLEKAQKAAKDERDFKEKKRAASHPNRTKAKPTIEATAAPTGFKFDSSWTKDSNNPTNSADFEIDTFDPHIHKTENEFVIDDSLLDDEVANINFQDALGGKVLDLNEFKTWGAPPLPDKNEVEGTEIRIRYGSPSNFEGTGWDSEWDTDIDESNAFRLNLPGLGYISAPSAFNIQGLSMDLASCRDDDIWDSDYDDDEDLEEFDEMDSTFTPDSPKPDEGRDQSFLINEEVSNETEINSPNLNSAKKVSVKESFESDWLSVYSDMYSDSQPYDDSVVEVPTPKENAFEQVEKSIKMIEKSRSRPPEPIEIVQSDSDDTDSRVDELTDSTISKSSGSIDSQTNATVAPAFGELLPDRESISSSSLVKKENEKNQVCRVHFDDQPSLSSNPGPSPSIVLQAFTMSNANDGINLERLETVGDSFLKYAITAYLYCSYTDIHEGKLSYLRSKQISNLNLYRLGKKCGLGQLMIASKFEPNDNWLPPGFTVPSGLEQALIDSGLPMGHWNIGNMKDLRSMDEEQIRKTVMEEKSLGKPMLDPLDFVSDLIAEEENSTPYIRYNLLTQQSIPDKSIADCVEALIGAYLVSCGPRGALLFMSWMGLKVLPDMMRQKRREGLTLSEDDKILANRFGFLQPPQSPLLNHIPDAYVRLEHQLSGFQNFETKIGYQFKDRAYLLQAFSHASYHYNRLTDCYQRLEFLGDAVLDYLITRYLYEDPQQHYPGVLTDLRSALVNNTFFASLAVKYDFHKYFKAISPGLFAVINRFVDMKRSSPGLVHFEEYYLEEEECEEAEEVEVPKALGDIFESVAGAIYLDSGMSLDTVWEVYYRMMKPEIEYFSTHVPKSPIRELLESYPQTARFDRAEMTLAGKVRIRVEVVGKGQFVGVGRNKRIAKCTAAKRALRALKKVEKK